MTGIYRIRNLRNQKSYIGQAGKAVRGFEKRFNEHRHYLRRGEHHSAHLQRAWDLHGERAFAFEVVEKIPQGQKSLEEFKIVLNEREQFHMDVLQTTNPEFGYNVSPLAGSQLGYRHSEETKRKMSAAGRGRKLPEKWRQSIADSMKAKGITRSQAERDSLSARRARLQKDDVFDALDLYEEGVSQEEIAQRFGISLPAMNKIIRGRSYRRVGEEWCRKRELPSLPNRARANVKFTKEEVFDILDRDLAGQQRQTIAAIYDYLPGNMTLICQGKYYKNWFEEWCQRRGIAADRRKIRKIKKLTRDDVQGIWNDLASGMKQRDIARKYGVSPPTVCDIKEGRTHKTAKRNRVP